MKREGGGRWGVKLGGKAGLTRGGEVTYSTWHVRGDEVTGSAAAVVVAVVAIVPTHWNM